MGYVDPLGRFIRDPDVDSFDGISSQRRPISNPLQFLTNLVRNEQDELVRIRLSLFQSIISFLPSFRLLTKLLHDLLKHLSMKLLQ